MERDNKKISVIILTFNEEMHIERCIQSANPNTGMSLATYPKEGQLLDFVPFASTRAVVVRFVTTESSVLIRLNHE